MHPESADLRKVNPVQIRIRSPDDFQNLTETSLFKEWSILKFSRRSDQTFRRYQLNCMSYIATLKKHLVSELQFVYVLLHVPSVAVHEQASSHNFHGRYSVTLPFDPVTLKTFPATLTDMTNISHHNYMEIMEAGLQVPPQRVRKKGATLFFAITLPNPNRSSKFFYGHTQL